MEGVILEPSAEHGILTKSDPDSNGKPSAKNGEVLEVYNNLSNPDPPSVIKPGVFRFHTRDDLHNPKTSLYIDT